MTTIRTPRGLKTTDKTEHTPLIDNVRVAAIMGALSSDKAMQLASTLQVLKLLQDLRYWEHQQTYDLVLRILSNYGY